MPQNNEITFTGENGFADTPAPDALPGYMATGSEGLYPDGPGMVRSFNDPTSSGAPAGQTGPAQATVISTDHGGITVSGSVFAYRSSPSAGNDSVIFVGSGTAYRAGASVGTASARMQMKIGAGSPFELGMAAPSAPTVVVSAGSGTKVDGTYSFKATWKRTMTHGESNASPATAPIVIAAGDRFKLTIPSQASSPGGNATHYRIFSTVANFSTLGPWFLFDEYEYGVDVAAGGGDVYLDYYDSDLLGISPPIGYDLPPDASHAFPIGGYLCAAGCYPVGGWGIAPSYLNNADAYNADAVVFLNPGAPITACVGRATDGFQYIACRDSLHAAIMTGDPTGPILARVLWGSDGFVGPNQMCYVETELYGQSSTRGPVRTRAGQEPDRSFAQPVMRTLEGFGASAVVGFDPASNQVVWASGTTAIAYMRGLDGNKWSTPLTLPASVLSKVTVGGRLYLILGSGTTGTLYRWNGGSPTSWTFKPFYRSLDGHQMTVTEAQVRASTTGTVNFSLLRGMEGTVVHGPEVLVYESTTRHSAWIKMGAGQLRSYTPKITGSGTAEIHAITVAELPEPAYRA